MAQISSTQSKRVSKYCTREQFDDNWANTFKKENEDEEDGDTFSSIASSFISLIDKTGDTDIPSELDEQ